MKQAPPALPGEALLLLPTTRDATLACDLLSRHGLPASACRDATELGARLDQAGTVVVCEEWLAQGAHAVLAQALAAQPPWSDLPVVVVAREGADSAQASDALAALGNITLLERPLRMTALVSAVRAGLRARGRQLELRGHLDALQASSELLADAARRKDALLAMLAHELRNPLAPVRNALQVLRHAPVDAAATARLHATMERQVDHLVHLVDDLLAMAQVTHDKVELRREPLPVSGLVEDAIAMVREPLEAAGHVVAIEPVDPSLQVCGDRVRLVQAVTNVLHNAVRYTPPGGRIAVEVRADARDVAIVVRDSGIGIEPELLPHIFELFSQGERSDRPVRDGLGIGLSLVRQLVELHGGTVHAASEGRGRGAVFTLSLPRHHPDARELPAPREPAAVPAWTGAPHAPLDVLVVDDNTDAAQTLALLLQALGHHTRTFGDGASALREVAGGAPPDVALLDLAMPGMDGFELARRLRTLFPGDAPRIAAVTGWDRPADRGRTRELGFAAHFAKPVDIDALVAFLDQARERPAASAA